MCAGIIYQYVFARENLKQNLLGNGKLWMRLTMEEEEQEESNL